MFYEDLIAEVSQRTGIDEDRVRNVIETMSDVAIEVLANEEGVKIDGLGGLNIGYEKEKSRDETGKPIIVIKAKYVKFTPSRRLREATEERYPFGR